MDTFVLLALIFAILLSLTTIPNIILDVNYIGWSVYLAWVATVENLVVSIFIMVGTCRPLSASDYKTCMILLIFGDVIALFDIIVFAAALKEFNWAKLINIIIITPLVIFVNILQKKHANMSTDEPIEHKIPSAPTSITPKQVQNPTDNNYQPIQTTGAIIDASNENSSNDYQPPNSN